MAKKKAKKTVSKSTKMDNSATPGCNKCPGCLLFAAIIIALVWWKPAVLWAQIVITVIAGLMLLCHAKHNSMCRIPKK